MRLHSDAIGSYVLQGIVSRVSEARYGGNLILEQYRHIGCDRQGRDKLLFTLAVRDSHGPGARRSASGRHMPKASWQAHRDVMRELFATDPNAFLHTALADYHGRKDFEAKFEETGERNVGSMMQPARMRDMAV